MMIELSHMVAGVGDERINRYDRARFYIEGLDLQPAAAGALLAYIDTTQAYFAEPSTVNDKLADDAIVKLEKYCRQFEQVMQAHTVIHYMIYPHA